MLQIKHAMFHADSGWQQSGTLQGIAELDGQRHKSAFFLDIDPMAQASTSRPDGAVAPQTSAAPAAPAKRSAIFAFLCFH